MPKLPNPIGKPNYLNKKTNSFRSWNDKFHAYKGEEMSLFKVVLRLQGSVITAILPSVLFFSGYGFLISFLYYHRIHLALPKINGVPNIVLTFNLVLSLLLIFRTNTAYDRFWEGRKLWGALVNTVRNLARGIWIVIEEPQATRRAEKEAALRLVVAFAVAMKLHLRREPVNEELMALMSSFQYFKLKDTNHPSLEIAFWVEDYLQHQYELNRVNAYQLTRLQNLVDELVNILGGCERILKTPLPLSYAIYLKQLLVLYSLILPLELVSGLSWWTGPVMAFISFIFFGIEELASELENPFGHDPNDLPLDFICNTLLRNIESLVENASSRTIILR